MQWRDEILSRALEVLRERPDVRVAEPGPVCTVRIAGESGERCVWLAPLLSEAARAADEPYWLERRLDAMLREDRAPDDFDTARGHLEVRLVTASWFGGEARYSDYLWREVGPGLAELAWFDGPLGRSTLARWGVDESEVFSAARESLSNAEVETEHPSAGASLVVLRSRDGSASACALNQERLRALAGGDVVCAFPRADMLVAARADDEGSRVRLFELASDEFARGERALSPLAYRVDEDRFVPVERRDGTPRDRLAAPVFLSRLYERQQAVLEVAGDPEAALLTVPEVDHELDDSPGLLVRWREGDSQLFPAADLVDLTDDSGHRRLLPFATVVAAGGGALVRTGHFPARWRTNRFPHEIMPDHH